MNQDFALHATPANARRLLRLHQISAITLPSDLIALAAIDRLDPASCDDPIGYAVTQFLLDGNLRGVVQADYHPTLTPLAMLNVLQLANAAKTAVISDRPRVWSRATVALQSPCQIVAPSALHLLDYDTALIYDTSYSATLSVGGRLRAVVCNFPRIIIFDDRRGFARLMHWSLWARLLFPAMPHPQYPRLLTDRPPAWSQHPWSAFAPFYNVCIFPEFITEPTIRMALTDDYADERLARQSSLLTLD